MSLFVQSIRSLRSLVLVQRSARLLLRAVWTGLAGYLIGWGLQRLLGVMPDSGQWAALGALFAAPSLLAIFRPLPMERLAWRLDRLFRLKEQVSTAWQTHSSDREAGPMGPLLFEDAAALLPEPRRRVLRRGWYLGKDTESLLIVLLLAAAIFLFGQFNSLFTIPESQTQDLPPLEQPPSAGDVFPSGIPGGSDPARGNEPGQQTGGEGPDPSQIGGLNDILGDLGQSLGQFPETAPAGQALEYGDLDGAAAQLESLADNIELLPPEALENMQSSFSRAAQQARTAGQDELADSLENAAHALQDPGTPPPAADALDQLADALRDLGASLAGSDSSEPPARPDSQDDSLPAGQSEGAAGAGASNTSQGQPEPLVRLEVEGGEIAFEGGQNPEGLLLPGGSASPPNTGSGPSAGTSSSGSTTPINSVLTPYSLHWRWLDVVSKYFSR